MAVAGYILDKSAAARSGQPHVAERLGRLAGRLYVCPVGRLEQLYSAKSAVEYDENAEGLTARFPAAPAPADLLERALALQRDLAHHHGLWHRMPIPDLLIAETALANDLGVVCVDADFARIAEVRPLEIIDLREV